MDENYANAAQVEPQWIRDARNKERDEKLSALAGCCAQQTTSPYRPTIREEHEKSFAHHNEQLNKHERAIAFFRENPAFDEFVRLIRQGVIQI